MKIIGNANEIDFIRCLLTENDVEVYCDTCPVAEQCGELEDNDKEQIGSCGNVIWQFVEVEEIEE